MITIIPNWHPIFVHFTVALFSTSVGLFLVSYILHVIKKIQNTFIIECEIVARWCLWLSALVTIITVSFGFYAYYTVKHDAISHAAMTIHRNWAIATALLIYILAAWSVFSHIRRKKLTILFFVILLITEGLLLSTAWHGGELVYRHGIGVMSLPSAEEVGHNHHHESVMKNNQNSSEVPPSDVHKHTHHSHDHQ